MRRQRTCDSTRPHPAPAYAGGVQLERRHALTLLAIASWNVLTYAQFTRALATTEEDRPVGYYVAHTVLIVVNLLIAVVLARWGVRALRASRGRDNQGTGTPLASGQPSDEVTRAPR